MTRVKMDIPYFQTPNNIFDVDLSPQELLVYIYLCRCGNHGGQAFPSYLTIANKCKRIIDGVKTLVRTESAFPADWKGREEMVLNPEKHDTTRKLIIR